MENLFNTAKELASPRTWNAGVELARNADFQEQASPSQDERVFRVLRGPKDRILTVSLSEENELWTCDCGQDDDPCAHVIGAIIAVRQGLQGGRPLVRSTTAAPATLVHIFSRQGPHLHFARKLVWEGGSFPVDGSLLAATQAMPHQKGAPKGASVSNDELNLDHVLGNRKHGILDPRTMRLLIPALSRVYRTELDGVSVAIRREPLLPRITVSDEGDGYRLRRELVSGVSEIFENGAALIDGALCAIEDSSLTSDDVRLISGEGTFFPRSKTIELAARIVPMLASKVRVEVVSTKLPRARRVPPRTVLHTISDDKGERLTIVPYLVYGEPPIARSSGAELELLSKSEVPIRDPQEEARLARELQQRLFLRLGEARVYEGEAAIRVTRDLQSFETYGNGTAVFTPAAELAPRVDADGAILGLSFDLPNGEAGATLEQVLEAWKKGAQFVPLAGGGWGAIPSRWLREHGEVVLKLLNSRNEEGRLPAHVLPDVAELCDSIGIEAPQYFARLKKALDDVSSLPNAQLPRDLTAQLRPYQQLGVNWLTFMKSHGLGAILADDMGLGKTLQAMCVISEGALVVAPTSVLYSWREQLRRFRPQLSVSVYHGPNRTIPSDAQVVLTTYAILRLDIEKLEQREWDTIALDEAQTIRNSDSQVARAAHRLKARFKLNLSGTPIENSLGDLWSQFHFINPGLLGSQRQFEAEFSSITDGNVTQARKLQRRVRPFILRRLKKDVAQELPPKTEVVIECELSQTERLIYEGVLAASRQEVVERLGAGDSVFSVLEVLLRLRQACCHTGLLPGHDDKGSSKVELLLESLEKSIAQEHRALVFSQWTSLLDLVEPHLRSKGISFDRIDGSTADRAGVVERFQRDDGASVMLLSLKAGGLGITLTRADHVYILDPWWNPAVEDQASDRAHRIGQENPVIVHRLVASETVEERVLELQNRKRALLNAALGEGGDLSLSREEVLELLS